MAVGTHEPEWNDAAKDGPQDASLSVASLSLPIRSSQTRAVPTEVPVAIVIQGVSVAVMMASPTDLRDFARGFVLTEGFVPDLSVIVDLEIVDHAKGIEVRIWLAGAASQDFSKRRRALAGPVGCGLCGVESLDEAVRPVPHVKADAPPFTIDELVLATGSLRAHQPLHDETHAVHGAGFLVPGGGLAHVREDVGRHNALDKLIGCLASAAHDPAQGAFVLTSRISVELVQKTAVCGCPLLLAVSAPTSLAIETADKAGLTICALSKGEGFEVFTHPERLQNLD